MDRYEERVVLAIPVSTLREASETGSDVSNREGRSPIMVTFLVVVIAGLVGVTHADTAFPRNTFRIVPRNGIETRLCAPSEAEEGTLSVVFEKADHVRRMVTMAVSTPSNMAEGRVLTVDGELRLSEGEAPRLCAVLFGRQGQRWIRKGGEVQPGEGRRSYPISAARMQSAAFAENPAEAFSWQQVERIWLGLVFDGPAKGVWHVQGVRLTNDPPPALVPVSLTHGGVMGWKLHHNSAAKAEMAASEAGPGGTPGLSVRFTFPGGRHMYCTCSLAVSAEQPELYRAVRLTYRASVPQGITGILFGMAEDSGALYLAATAPAPSAEWRTLTLPYDALKRAGWTRDPNGRLDPETLTMVWVGTHGTAAGEGGAGQIEVASIELVP